MVCTALKAAAVPLSCHWAPGSKAMVGKIRDCRAETRECVLILRCREFQHAIGATATHGAPEDSTCLNHQAISLIGAKGRGGSGQS
jgi:hypothetical protein